MYQAGVEEQVIKEYMGHKSDCVRMYKKTAPKQMVQANKCVSGDSHNDVKTALENVSPPKDYDKVGLDMFEGDSNPLPKAHELPKTFVEPAKFEQKSHKRRCLVALSTGSCNEVCAVLDSIDQATLRKAKKVKLSLKFCKNKSTC